MRNAKPVVERQMQLSAKKAEQGTTATGRGFRLRSVSIGTRLATCFMAIIVLMLVADSLAAWQFSRMEASNERLRKADDALRAVVRVHVDIGTFRDRIAIMASRQETREFAKDTASLKQTFLADVERARRMVTASRELDENGTTSSAFQTLRTALPAQVDTVNELANAGDWTAVRLRLEHQIQELRDLSLAQVEKVDEQLREAQSAGLETSREARRSLFVVVPIAALFTLLGAAVLGWYLTRSITVPLSELAAGARALAHGDFQHEIHVSGNDELAVVGRAFNHATRQLQELYEELREQASLLSLTHDAIYVRDGKGVIQYWNRGAEELYGWPAEYAVGEVAHDLLKAVPPVPLEQIQAELLRTGRWEGEFLKTKKDGTQIVVASRWSLKRDHSDAPVAILVTSNDVTARKRAEEAARRSEKELRDVIETVPAMLWSTLPDGSLDFINHRWQEFTGLTAQDALGWNWGTVVHPQDHEGYVADWRAALATGQAMESEIRVRAASGEYRWLVVRNVPLRDELGKIVKWYGTSFDIQERKRAEEALYRSETYLAEAQRLTHTGSYAYDGRTNTFPYWSEEHFRIWGFDPQQNPPDGEALLQRVHPEDREIVRELSVKALRERSDYTAEYRIVLPDGTLKYIEAIGHPVSREREAPILVIGTHVDVTERKRADQERERLRQVEADLAHINRVSMMGELAASIAHEVNQPLTGIVSNASACLRWLAQDKPELEEIAEAVRDIVRDGKRAGEVIARIRALTRRAVGHRESLDLNETIREVLALIGDQAKRNNVTVRTELADNLSAVSGDRVQLQQVVLNLVVNAIEAMSCIGDRERELVITTRAMDPDHVQTSVEDSGTGLDPSSIDKIFDSFYTTKSGGMGMGLSITRSIVLAHGGRLWAVNKEGLGTIFHFSVPKYHQEGIHAGATRT